MLTITDVNILISNFIIVNEEMNLTTFKNDLIVTKYLFGIHIYLGFIYS